MIPSGNAPRVESLYLSSYNLQYSFKDTFCFAHDNISFSRFTVLDNCNADEAKELVRTADFIFLMGGHVPTQNEFFQKIQLRQFIATSKALVMGFSAGSMNMADVVYAQPELEGEAVNPNYKRFLNGLGLSKTMILLHYQYYKNEILDGLRIFEEVTYSDSVGHTFYALVDGSYVEGVDGVETIYGEAYRISDGMIEKNSDLNGVYEIGS